MGKVLKWIAIVLGGLIGLVVAAFLVLGLLGGSRLNRTYNVEPESIPIPNDPASLERGRHLAQAICADCHGADLGGEAFLDESGLATFYAPNITTGAGGMGGQPVDDLVLAIRHGIDQDGTPLLVMPAEVFVNFSAEDLGAVIAYLKEAPPVENSTPAPKISWMGRVLLAAGLFGKPFPAEYVNHNQPFPDMPPVGANPDYGAYLVKAAACTTCHGENLAGGITPPSGSPGEMPLPPNLTQGGELAGWSEDEFVQTLQSGVMPSGEKLNPEYMPWGMTSRMDADELRGIWAYLQTLPPVEEGAE
jgi:mono/diheme cytochrome c family protein